MDTVIDELLLMINRGKCVSVNISYSYKKRKIAGINVRCVYDVELLCYIQCNIWGIEHSTIICYVNSPDVLIQKIERYLLSALINTTLK